MQNMVCSFCPVISDYHIYIYIYVVGKKEQFARLLISLKNSKDPNILLQGGKKTKEKSVNC